MAGERVELSARELMTETFNVLKYKFNGKEIKLPYKALAEIANDSDWHRTRVGYTGYESAVIVKIGEKEWAIAFGTACGNYPADPYNCDIAAVQFFRTGKFDQRTAGKVHMALEDNDYFRNSLIFAMANGQLSMNKESRFSQKVLELLGPKVEDFIAQDLETDPHYFTMDGRPVVKSAIRYRREFVAFLAETLQAALTA